MYKLCLFALLMALSGCQDFMLRYGEDESPETSDANIIVAKDSQGSSSIDDSGAAVIIDDRGQAIRIDAQTGTDQGQSNKLDQGNTVRKDAGAKRDVGAKKDVGIKIDVGASASPPTLTSSHSGYQNPICTGSSCHALPYHSKYSAGYQCPSCHGKNGTPTKHHAGDNCYRCHNSKHGYATGQCASCHY